MKNYPVQQRDVVIAERLSAMAEEALGRSEGKQEHGDAGLRAAETDGR